MCRGDQAMKAPIELHLHNFKECQNDFTFVPYGLKSGLSKEVVKVHVLHGRKRNRNQQTPLSSKQDGALQGRMFEWNSKATYFPEPRKTKGLSNDRCEDNASQKNGTFSHQLQHPSHDSYKAGRWLSQDHQVLCNPFVGQIRDELGTSSDWRIRSANYLVDHYLSRCGTSRFPRELLACYWFDAAVFKAFLAHAATLFSLETGMLPPVSVEELMCSALQEIRMRLSNSAQRYADGTTLAVALLANVEEGRTQHQNAAFHWRGLKQLLRLRGSFSSIRTHRNLHTMLLWREILTSNSYDFCFGHGIADVPELQHCTEHIVSFFDNFADHLSEGGHLQHADEEVRSFLATIVNRKIIRQCEWTSSMSRRSEIACLIYLAMFVISAGVSAESRKVMERVREEVVERDRWGKVSQEELLFVILQQANIEHEWRCQQLWQLSRCIYLTRTLGAKDWKTVRDLLSLFVGIEEGCDNKFEVLQGWAKLSNRLLLEDECHGGTSKSHATGWASVPK